MFKVQANSVLQ